ncbi:GNAT family N-acetyltransferase [Streptomyces fuscigenes]|uniref:GNAT family N-acetyltransferase n=1 Tax=Streptomyces fuscigenes TaxID=1528880 RepID=UPI001F37D656|nr:GNAT family N-acetyltransferase [Streptomyces fuscigenes]MCF3965237.1 GNAT family N-acetyltransferase [Streptomyces fuscigenes]
MPPRLVAPDARYRASFLAAIQEFVTGEESDSGQAVAGQELERWGANWASPAVFASYVDGLNAERYEETPRVEGWVPCTHLWFVDGDEFLGRLSIRHRFTPFLLEYGGHIGYSVRPTARRRGHATAMLRGALPVARELGLDQVLVTCDAANVASRKVIEAVDGRFEDRRGEKLRYWVSTGS